jgi:hypothetical protein
MEKLKIGRLAKLALNSPGLQELSEGAVERLAKIRPHADIRGVDWDTFVQYAENRLAKAPKLVNYSGPLGRFNGLTDYLAKIMGDEFIEVELDQLLIPLRRRLSGVLVEPSDVDNFVVPEELSDAYLRARSKVVRELITRWRSKILITYHGTELIDFREDIAVSNSCLIIWVPTPEQLLEHAISSFKWWCTADEEDFPAILGKVLVNQIRSWLFYFERMSGFYGRNALAVQVYDDAEGVALSPLSLDAFKGAIIACLTPDAYASVVINDMSGNGRFAKHIDSMEESKR